MRLGVLDIGSNTGHLLVVDAHLGAAPMPASSYKEPLRLAEHLVDGSISDKGVSALVEFINRAVDLAEDMGCERVFSFATSAVRDAENVQHVLERVTAQTSCELLVLSGADEARLTFLAARRWYGWSAGRLSVFDIGGGSLEIAGGVEELPDVAWSLPLGAGRLTRERLTNGKPTQDQLRSLRKEIRAEIARDAGSLLRSGTPDLMVATSKTFRSLSRICGAAPSSEGPFVKRVLRVKELRPWIPKLTKMDPAEIAELPGVSTNRSHQMLAGALIAEAVMDIFEAEELEICPWALREGVILDKIDRIDPNTPETIT
jgi:exopolyphosphatase/guanosine-5'-triphosphate,3'-diphosphate pyrophosphatase